MDFADYPVDYNRQLVGYSVQVARILREEDDGVPKLQAFGSICFCLMSDIWGAPEFRWWDALPEDESLRTILGNVALLIEWTDGETCYTLFVTFLFMVLLQSLTFRDIQLIVYSFIFQLRHELFHYYRE